MPPFTAGKNLLRNFLNSQILILFCFSPKCWTKNKKGPLSSNLITQLLKLIMAKILRGYINEIAFSGMTMLPINGIAWCILKTFKLAKGFGQHRRIEFFADNPIIPFVFLKKRGRELVITEPAAAFPTNFFSNASLVFAINYFFESRNNMRMAMFSQLNHNPSTSHFMGDSTSRS